MAARFVRAVRLALLLLPLSAQGGDVAVEQQARELARQRFLHALTSMGEAMESCEKHAKTIAIPRGADIGVGREALLAGVAYFNLKRSNECSAPAAKELLMSVKMLERGAGSGLEREPAKEFVDMVLEGWWNELEAEARYRNTVSVSDRAKVEAIEGLREPFNMIRSWERSGN